MFQIHVFNLLKFGSMLLNEKERASSICQSIIGKVLYILG